MISQDEFSLFDPQKTRASALPDKPGNYIIVLRSTSSLPIKVQISTTPILTSFQHKKEKYNVVYVAKAVKVCVFVTIDNISLALPEIPQSVNH